METKIDSLARRRTARPPGPRAAGAVPTTLRDPAPLARWRRRASPARGWRGLVGGQLGHAPLHVLGLPAAGREILHLRALLPRPLLAASLAGSHAASPSHRGDR